MRLYGDYIIHAPMMPGLLRTFQPEQYPESVVVMVDDQVIGFLLAQVEGEVVRIPALAVLPEYRGKGLAIRMIAALEDKLGDEVKRGEFEFLDIAIFTAKIAAAFGHEVVRIGARFERSLNPQPPP
jgi:GNAT superfamily N-acetyltransferase